MVEWLGVSAMSERIDATFDGTVFRPTLPVSLPPNTPVRLVVETIQDTTEHGANSFLQTAQRLNLDGPPDWSENLDQYLYGQDSERAD